jgi:ABC-type lipoprotein export system ATPase subunit/GNAT superfamily N-acetyltransferase
MLNKEIILTSPIIKDEYTDIVGKMFDVPISNKSTVIIKNNIVLPTEWNIGLIYGNSGAGKSTLLKEFGKIRTHKWDNTIPMISNFKECTPHEASEILCSVGFGTVPAWIRPYKALSNGEQFRANLAKSLIGKDKIILIDEFTSVVDRNVAKSAANSVQKYIRKHNKKIILASCHSDIIEWLVPDWTYNPIEGETRYFTERSLRHPNIELEVFRSKYEAWDLFKSHHYLSAGLNKSAKCYLATWEGIPIAFTAILSFPHPIVKKAWRESRTVVLPDYQGLGIGVKLSNYMGSIFKAHGCRFFSKTAHPAMISSRIRHPELWIQTRHSRKARNDHPSDKSSGWLVSERLCHAFEYVGPPASKEEAKLFL